MKVYHLVCKNKDNVLYNIDKDKFMFFDYEIAMNIVAKREFILVEQDNKVIGICSLVDSSFRSPGNIGLAYIETHQDFRNQGVSKLLVKALFDYAEKQNKKISIGWYEPDGELYLKHQIDKMAKKRKIAIF